MGLGLFGGGVAAARWLVERGARVTVTDLRDAGTLAPALAELEGLPLEFVLGRHRARDFETAALVVANPAVPPDAEWLTLARKAGARVTSEVELFLRTSTARLVLVTGTQGKSSTTSLLAQLLEAAGIGARAGGNIGTALLGADLAAHQIAVVELSSYQLEALPRPCPAPPRVEAALVTGLLADHLERHGDEAGYAAAKARVLELVPRDGVAWLPAGLLAHPAFHPPPCPVRPFGPGTDLRLEGGRFRLGQEDLGAAGDLTLPGAFQRENTLLALGAARALGADRAHLVAAIAGLRGLPHRLQELGRVAGRRVLDNGVSTTPDSTEAALTGVEGDCTLLVGGQRKRGLPFDALVAATAARGARVVAFGAAAGELVELFAAAGVPAEAVDTVSEAATRGLDRTAASGTLLFSPACASFDQFPNFRARALAFRAALDPLRAALDP